MCVGACVMVCVECLLIACFCLLCRYYRDHIKWQSVCVPVVIEEIANHPRPPGFGAGVVNRVDLLPNLTVNNHTWFNVVHYHDLIMLVNQGQQTPQTYLKQNINSYKVSLCHRSSFDALVHCSVQSCKHNEFIQFCCWVYARQSFLRIVCVNRIAQSCRCMYARQPYKQMRV